MTKDLTYWGKAYGTDKATYHGYTSFYEDVISDLLIKPQTILEIGIKEGASLKMWKSRFPDAIVIGMDINHIPNIPGITTIIADATNESAINFFFRNVKFDIIIDDGSHQSKDVLKTYGILNKYLSWGGIYIYEDCHCSFLEEYTPKGELLAYDMLKLGKKTTEYWKDPNKKTDSGTLVIYHPAYKI